MKKLHATLMVTGIVAILIVSISAITARRANPLTTLTPSSTSVSGPSSVGIESVTTSQAAAAAGSNAKTITWQTSGLPAGQGVTINLIRKISDSPATYTLVRQIAVNTANTGAFTWTPTADESGSNLYVEVTCAGSSALAGGCQVSTQPISVN